jgi:hypothetical protein
MRARDHRRLQAELLAIIRAREAKARLPEFAASWDRGREPAYVAALEAARKEYFAMALDLDRTLTPRQRERATKQLQRYAEDFRALSQRR